MKVLFDVFVYFLLITMTPAPLSSNTNFDYYEGMLFPPELEHVLGPFEIGVPTEPPIPPSIARLSFQNIYDNKHIVTKGIIAVNTGYDISNISINILLISKEKMIVKIVDALDIETDEHVQKFGVSYEFNPDYEYVVFDVVVTGKSNPKRGQFDV